jgi:hypothetical protein
VDGGGGSGGEAAGEGGTMTLNFVYCYVYECIDCIGLQS